MSAVDRGVVLLYPPIAAGRRLRFLALALGAAYLAYVLLAVLGAPSSIVSPLFSVFMAPVPFAVWWAWARAPAELRRLIFLLGWAATLWLVGTLVWYGYYFAAGSVIPEPPGTFDVFFVLARLLVIAAVVDALRSLISFRIAALDVAVLSAASLAAGTAFVWRGLEAGASATSLVTLNRPLLGIVTLALIVSAAYGSWWGLPRSIVLIGLGEVALTIGSLVYSFQAIQGTYVDDRWAALGWAAGAALSILAAAVIITRADGTVRLPGRTTIPRHPGGSRPALAIALGSLVLTLGVACYGLLAESGLLIAVGLLASATIGVAMALRARSSISSVEAAYARLDRALMESEHAHDDLVRANVELARTNVQLQYLYGAVSDLLNLADERSGGRMRELVDDLGPELAELIGERMMHDDSASRMVLTPPEEGDEPGTRGSLTAAETGPGANEWIEGLRRLRERETGAAPRGWSSLMRRAWARAARAVRRRPAERGRATRSQD